MNQLIEFLGSDRGLSQIDAAEAYQYQLERRKTCAQASVSKDVKIAKTAFKHAKMLGYIELNPFEEIVAGTDVNPENAFYLDIPSFEQIIESCPNSTWRVIVALGRIGGLRTPSEFRGLRWRDVNLPADRMLVTAPKTKRQRRVRIFPRLKQILEEHLERTGETSEYLIDVPHYRDPNANLRTQLSRIVTDAGIPSFPRPFDNFRASASTDLATVYPIKQAADWLGHSTQTALKYYHMSHDRDFTASELETIRQCFGDLTCSALQNPVQYGAALVRNESQTQKAGDKKGTENEGVFDSVRSDATACTGWEVTPTGLEPVLPP